MSPAYQIVSPVTRCETSPEGQPKFPGAVGCWGWSMSSGVAPHLTFEDWKEMENICTDH